MTVSKLIYTEAILVFYENNRISVDIRFCDYKALMSPLATDLSLATQIMTRIDLEHGCDAVKPNEPIGPVR